MNKKTVSILTFAMLGALSATSTAEDSIVLLVRHACHPEGTASLVWRPS